MHLGKSSSQVLQQSEIGWAGEFLGLWHLEHGLDKNTNASTNHKYVFLGPREGIEIKDKSSSHEGQKQLPWSSVLGRAPGLWL